MSSQTPNLNLVLPVGTEKVSRQIINDNNTKIDTAVGANSSAITNLSGKIDCESVSTLPFRTGIFYCSSAQTIGSVTIPNHFIYDIHVSGTTATGIAVRATTGVAYSLYGYDGVWVSAVELATKSDVPIITRKTSNHSSATTNSSGYVEIDTYSSLGVDTSLYCIGMIIRGWSGNNPGMTIAKGSNGSTFFLTGPASTTLTGFSVEYYFVNLVS